jgi:hypothetical protein
MDAHVATALSLLTGFGQRGDGDTRHELREEPCRLPQILMSSTEEVADPAGFGAGLPD